MIVSRNVLVFGAWCLFLLFVGGGGAGGGSLVTPSPGITLQQ